MIVAIVLLALAAVTGAARVIRIPRLGTGVRAGLAAAGVACVALTVMPPIGRPSGRPPWPPPESIVHPVDTLPPPLTAAEESALAARPPDVVRHEEVMGAEGEDTIWAPTWEGMLGTWTLSWREGETRAMAWVKEFEKGGGTVEIRRIFPGGREQNIEADLEISSWGDSLSYVAANARRPLNGPRIAEEYPLFFTLKHLPNGEWTYGRACVRQTCHDVTVLRRPPWSKYDPP